MFLKRTSLFLLVALVSVFSRPVWAADPIAPAAPAAPVAAAPAEPAADSGNVTLDFKEADINTVLRVMSMKSNMNIVAGPEVQGQITIRLENVPWEKALQVVLRTYGYVYEKEDNIIRVTTRDNLATEPLVTQTYVLNYTKAAEIKTAVQDMLTERGRIKVAERTNTIVLTDIPTNLFNIGEIIHNLDHITPQAFVDSKVLKTDVGVAENLGIEWQTGGTQNNLGAITGSSRPTTLPFQKDETAGMGPFNQFFPNFAGATAANPGNASGFPLQNVTDVDATNTTFSYGTLNFSSFGAVLQMLKRRTNTKVVSNPRIVVLNNQTANIQVGSDVPLPTFERNETTGSVEVTGFRYRQTGVVLKVTPHINSQEEILVDLQPEVSSQGVNVNFGDFQVPTFNVTKAVTQVLIRNGETIAIGGLLTDNVSSAESKVPYLSDIPLAGKLFRSKRQTEGDSNKKVETLFFITVTMVDTEGQPASDRSKTASNSPSASANNAPQTAVATKTVPSETNDEQKALEKATNSTAAKPAAA